MPRARSPGVVSLATRIAWSMRGRTHTAIPCVSQWYTEVDPAEAAVVRRIFELYSSGLGLRAIAKALTVEGAVAPRPFVRRDPTKVQPVRGWAPGTIRAILARDVYRGVVVWNRSKKRDDWGSVHQRPRPQRNGKRRQSLLCRSSPMICGRGWRLDGPTPQAKRCASPMGGCPAVPRSMAPRICWPDWRRAPLAEVASC